ncbi:MAG TPA: type II toxin-antitoxin system VapC family toxin [Agitococcus sp.]|nr:type II toxin-antitoxin system VapC family toxin [Agitococcus sp.]
MSKILLDTNICIYVMNRRPIEVLKKFQQYSQHLAISSIVLAGLRFGASHSSKPEHNHQQVNQFCQCLDIVPFDEQAAFYYGEIRTKLKYQGQLIGDNDLLIAAHALALNALLVTNNVKEFQRVDGLNVENWIL